MDIDELRELHIHLHDLTSADGIYTFYHDETNNVRKLQVKPGGFNVAALKVFVLGGVVHDGAPRPLDIAGLRDVLHIQKNAPELKLEYLGNGDFAAVLRSPKLTLFLRWLAPAAGNGTSRLKLPKLSLSLPPRYAVDNGG